MPRSSSIASAPANLAGAKTAFADAYDAFMKERAGHSFGFEQGELEKSRDRSLGRAATPGQGFRSRRARSP